MLTAKFTVIIPTLNRSEYFLPRAINSVLAQTFQDFEILVVDDGGKDKCEEVCKSFNDDRIKYIKKAGFNRCGARNEGLRNATGEWICTLDDDDCYSPVFLEAFNKAIIKYPDYKVFNSGFIQVHRNYGVTVKPAKEFKPQEVFPSGTITSGAFIFKREILEDVGYMPEDLNLWKLAAWAKEKYPEIAPLFPNGKELGNPWGDDYLEFYMITRKYNSKCLNTALYIYCGKHGNDWS